MKKVNLTCVESHIGNPHTEHEFGDSIWAYSPSIVFVAETWLKKARLIYLHDKLKFDGMIEFSKEGRGGGFLEKRSGFLSGYLLAESYWCGH